MSMRLEDYFDFQADDDIRIKGRRIGIEHVLYEHIYRAKTPEEIAAELHTLSLEQVYATILYYLRNRKSVEKYLADWIDFGKHARAKQKRNPTPFMRRKKLGQARLRRAS